MPAEAPVTRARGRGMREGYSMRRQCGLGLPIDGRAWGGRRRSFDAAVGVAGEAALGAGVNGIVAGPGPAAELCALVVGDRLLDLPARVHHEGSVVHHRLTDRAPL